MAAIRRKNLEWIHQFDDVTREALSPYKFRATCSASIEELDCDDVSAFKESFGIWNRCVVLPHVGKKAPDLFLLLEHEENTSDYCLLSIQVKISSERLKNPGNRLTNRLMFWC